MAILEVKNLNLGFQSEDTFRQALFDVSFSLEKGKMLSIVGESGCGKSTLSKGITKLVQIKSGEILGYDINEYAVNYMDSIYSQSYHPKENQMGTKYIQLEVSHYDRLC